MLSREREVGIPQISLLEAGEGEEAVEPEVGRIEKSEEEPCGEEVGLRG